MLTVFNPKGSDRTSERKVFYGNSTGIINLNNVKYPWAVRLYEQMRENFWIPEKLDITQDINDYKHLTPHEQKAFDGILGYLVFLDSVQVQNIPYLSSPCSAPEISICFSEQTSQEAMHSKSYAYMIETILPKEKKDYIYDYWRNDSALFERCQVIGRYYQRYIDTPNRDNHIIAIIADYILEGIYFYCGFLFFYNLASRSLMAGSADIFKMINRDELSHVRLYQELLKDSINQEGESRQKWIELNLREMMKEAVEAEIKWCEHIIGDNILGMPIVAIREYLKYLANNRMKALGFSAIYEGEIRNPFKHLESIADTSKDANVKTNFFDATVTSYQMSSVLEEWDF